MKVRWSVIWWLFLISLIAYMDRMNFAVAVIPMMKELGISATQMGLIMSGFSMGYLLLNFPGGIIADKYNPSKMLAVILVLWSVATLATGMAWGFLSLFIIRFLFGMGEGSMLPTNTKIVNNWALPRERASANGLWLAALMLGVVIGAPLSGYIVSNWGWRSVFYIFAAMGILVGLLTPFVIKSRPEESARVSKEELTLIKDSISEFNAKQALALGNSSQRAGWLAVLSDKWAWVLMLIYFFSALLFWANVSWLPTYFVKARGIKLSDSALLAALPYLVAIAGATLGYVSDRFTKSWRTPWLIVACSMTIPMIVLSVNAQTLTWSMVGFCVSTFFNWGLVTMCYTIPMELWTRDKVATIAGFMATGGAVAGIIAPTIVGYILDKTGSFKAPYYVFAGATVIALILSIVLNYRERQVKRQHQAVVNISPNL